MVIGVVIDQKGGEGARERERERERETRELCCLSLFFSLCICKRSIKHRIMTSSSSSPHTEMKTPQSHHSPLPSNHHAQPSAHHHIYAVAGRIESPQLREQVLYMIETIQQQAQERSEKIQREAQERYERIQREAQDKYQTVLQEKERLNIKLARYEARYPSCSPIPQQPQQQQQRMSTKSKIVAFYKECWPPMPPPPPSLSLSSSHSAKPPKYSKLNQHISC